MSRWDLPTLDGTGSIPLAHPIFSDTQSFAFTHGPSGISYHQLPSMTMKSSADKELFDLGVQMVPDVQNVRVRVTGRLRVFGFQP